MFLGLRGKTALVAAASKGLGYAIARELAMEGATIVICARTKETLKAARDSLAAETGAKVYAIPADLSRFEDIKRVTTTSLERLGRVDILINNNGGPPAGPFETHDWATWQGAFDLTMRSAVEMTRAVLPGMKERRWGRVINVTSMAAKQPVDNLILSNSLRAAVHGFARTLANEVAEFGITVNNIMPGYTRTERVESLAEATAKRDGIDSAAVMTRFEKDVPMKRMGEPEEFAALAAFLASERASYITAQSIAADGGWIRGLM
ncbi:MAG: SDR family oxidoreductase [Gemmatimonadaceae bacterium]